MVANAPFSAIIPGYSTGRLAYLAGLCFATLFRINFAFICEVNVQEYERSLGIIEALTTVRDQCPHGGVRDHAARALDTIGEGGPDILRQQAFLVLSTIKGWRGDRAEQVKRALRSFVGNEAQKSQAG